MARPDTWMPMYWRDFWADTGHLSPVEGWAYLNLIGAYWTNGGPLTNDDARLARQAKVSAKEWKAIRPTVIAFFAVSDAVLNHRRIDAELTEATRLYDKRKAHIDAVNEKRRQKQGQSLSTVTVNNTVPIVETATATQPQLQPQSPNGKSEAKASGTRKRAPPKVGTRISPDWKPSSQDIEHAEVRNYSRENIEQLAAHFRDYHLAKGTVSRDWSASWRTWIANDQKFSAQARRGAGRQQSRHDRPEPRGIVDLADRLKARANLGGQHHRNGGMGRGGDGLQPAGDERDGEDGGFGSGGIVIDADDAERMYRPADRTEAVDEGAAGAGEGPGSATPAVRKEAGGIPGGCGAQGPDDTAEHSDVVALMVGTEGEAGPVYAASAPRSGSPEDYSEIPGFLDRRHEFDPTGH